MTFMRILLTCFRLWHCGRITGKKQTLSFMQCLWNALYDEDRTKSSQLKVSGNKKVVKKSY